MDASVRAAPVFAAVPGLAVAFALGAAAFAIHGLPGLGIFSPAILAVLFGILARRLAGSRAHGLKAGLTLSTKTLLRAAVALLGLQITLTQVAALGWPVLLAVICGLLACFLGTVWLGKRLGVEERMARLIGIGTAVCGASAVVAGNSVIKGDDEDVAYALAAVTVFGTISMLALPFLAFGLGLDTEGAALWLGSSIHEVAQVVGAATQLGQDATSVATVAKMARVSMLAPMVLLLAWSSREKTTDTSSSSGKLTLPVPWFVLAFLALSAVASLGLAPAPLVKVAGLVSSFLLAAALGAMGYGLEVEALRRKGAAPLILAFLSSCLIAAASLLLLHFAR